ncbi:MAG: class I SAM-dependent methyltransferase [Anaerolineae bacterium]|nr:class I SAM-dependent methyltransferase [Anaerolineae bacterium]
MPNNTKHLVRQQFGSHSADYITSAVHARGYSLSRLLDLLDPLTDWRVLDVATGGGHTALAFAQRARAVVAADLTRPMLQSARCHIEQQEGAYVDFCQSDAELFPFAAGHFDAITCRLAAHHFPDVTAFVRESARVLKPGGLLGLVDNVVSGEAKIARFVNTFEKLRDPSHHWAYSIEDWETFFFAAGLSVTHSELIRKEVDFDDWASRMGVAGNDLTRLRVLLMQAPDGPREWLKPQQVGSRLVFVLTEAVVIGHKPS